MNDKKCKSLLSKKLTNHKTISILLSSILGLLCVFTQDIPPPQVGDFESRTTGNWNATTSWNVYNGTSWVTTSTYPGQGTTATNPGNVSSFCTTRAYDHNEF